MPSLLRLIDKHKYDVIFLSETKVYLKSSVKSPGYHLIQSPRALEKVCVCVSVGGGGGGGGGF